MHEYLVVGAEHSGLLVWLLWALIGVFAAMVASRMTQGRRILWFDIIIGLVASTLGGYLSTQFLGDTPLPDIGDVVGLLLGSRALDCGCADGAFHPRRASRLRV